MLAWAGLIWAIGAAIFFRHWWSSGFDLVMGNRGDGRFIAFVLEHWRVALAGAHSWTSPPMFHPLQGGLGRSDALFGFLPFYLPLRWAGVDVWAAFQWTLVAITCVGFVSVVCLAHRIWRLPLWASLAGAWLFAFPNNLHIQAGHAQMFAVQFIAPLLVAASLAIAWRTARPVAAAIAAACFGAGLALLFFTSYYAGWFFGFACLVFAIACAVLGRAGLRRDSIKPWLRLGHDAAIGFAVAIVPFVYTYLPLVLAGSRFEYADMIPLMGAASDIWNVGPNNLLFGSPLKNLGTSVTPHLGSGEHSLMVTPLLGLFCVVATVLAWRRGGPRDVIHIALMAALVTGGVLVVMTLHVQGFSLWQWIREVVPGASAMRAIMRAHLVTGAIAALAVPVLLVLLHGVARNYLPPRGALACAIAVALLFVVEQVNIGRNAGLSRAAELAWLDRVAQPPRECSAFFVTAAKPAIRPFYELQIDAMLVSLKTGLPTLNGYTGIWPREWLMIHPEREDYLGQVADWVGRYRIGTDLCVLDTGTWAWSAYAPR